MRLEDEGEEGCRANEALKRVGEEKRKETDAILITVTRNIILTFDIKM